MQLRLHHPDDPALTKVLSLIRTCFGEHRNRIDPPSSMYRLTLDALCDHAMTGEVWSLGPDVVACMILTPADDHLYLSKLSVDPGHRGTGLARALVEHAVLRTRDLGLLGLVLQTRIELVENHALFQRLGFYKITETSHPGFARPTSITMLKSL